MNTISIGGAHRPLADADSSWIQRQFSDAARNGGGLPCVHVSIQTSTLHMSLSTPTCPASGGGGRRPTAGEAEILNLWTMEGLTHVPFTPREVVDFVDRVKRLVR